ncbi:MAG TPA: hypothetical protein PKY25_02285 [Bacilli bacterium]|nr:hypothetical protein [Bacilli bacterium]
MIKKLKILLILFIFLFIPLNINASEKVNIYLFYGDGCPHCAEEEEYIDTLYDKYDIKLYKYEVWYNVDNQLKMNSVEKLLDMNVTGVPFLVVNNTGITGFSKGITETTIEYHIKDMINNPKADKVGELLGVVKKTNDKLIKQENKDFKITLPFIGKVDLKKMSLPVVSLVIGLVDGFNPCAMWILLFLISMLINMKDRKKMWILGITFLLTSSIIYLAFMLTWLNFAKMLSSVAWVRLLISLVAIVGGILNLRSYINTKEAGCDVVSDNKRNKIFERISKYVKEKSFWLSILGIMFIAASVNLIELACSVGLPVIFTQLLALNNLSIFESSIYIFIYILFFMLDDLIVFIIAMKTFELTGISTRYNKYSHLIGGLLMLIIGVLMIVKPAWLMFNF